MEQQANRNKFKNNKTGLSGVCYEKVRNKYRAEITINYKNINLGRFKTRESAKLIRGFAVYCRKYIKDKDELVNILKEFRTEFKSSKDRVKLLKLKRKEIKTISF